MPQHLDLKISEIPLIKASFTDKTMTAYGGFGLIAKFLNKINFEENITSFVPFQETSPNSTGVYAKIIRFGLTIIAGGKRFSHTMFLGDSLEIYETAFNIKRIPKSITAVTRFFQKFVSQKLVEEFTTKLWDYQLNTILKLMQVKEDYLTFDSTVITRYGDQEGVAIGYNPRKKGRASHHPIMAFLNRSRFIANFWHRTGSSSSGNGIIEFSKQTFHYLKDRIKIIGILADSGFYKNDFLTFLEEKIEEKVIQEYVIAAALYKPLQQKIWDQKNWIKVDDGIDVCEFEFHHKDWENRKYIVVRKKINFIGDKTTGKMLNLMIEDYEEAANFRYGAYVVSSSKSAVDLWRIYRLRAADEGIIKELKYDFSFEGFSMDQFYPTEVAMLMRVLFYNLMECFTNTFLNEQDKKISFNTLRMKYLLIPAVLGKDGKDFVLRLAIKSQKLKEKIINIIRELDAYDFKCIAFENMVSNSD
jgi:hypothetical protein